MTTVATSLAHLLPEAAIAALLPDEDRFSYIDSDRWLPYQRANQVIALLEDFLKRPRINRPPNMMLVGRSDNGKSHILEHFANLHPGVMNSEGPNITAQVMLLETPPTANANDLYDTILYMLNQPRPANKSRESRRDAAKDILRNVGTKILMLDEINHLLSGNLNRQREFLFALKHLSNELRMSVVIAGTPESLQLLHVSDQIENRFRPEPLPLWVVGLEMRTLLANFEQVLPLRQPSSLSRKETAVLIHSFGIETIGGFSNILNRAAKEAITSGTECITADILRKCAPKTSSERKLERSRL
ncbi:MAG: TniB family NTP-binding protein [Pseudomonadota bacterium]